MGYHVYTLSYPDTGIVFYVGKGKDERKPRVREHRLEARNGIQSAKCDTIRRIWAEGKDIVFTIVAEFAEEADAFAHENELIVRYGQSLTNIDKRGIATGQKKATLNTIGRLIESLCQQKAAKEGLQAYTWDQLAKDTGVTPSAIARTCRGKTRPTYDLTMKLWQILGQGYSEEDQFYNTFGFASPQQMATVEPYVEQLEEEMGLSS